MSRPFALRDAGGRLFAGDLASAPDAAGCGEKYEAEFVLETALGVKLGEVGLVNRRARPSPVEGIRDIGRASGAVAVR